jgi:hypothetical protein
MDEISRNKMVKSIPFSKDGGPIKYIYSYKILPNTVECEDQRRKWKLLSGIMMQWSAIWHDYAGKAEKQEIGIQQGRGIMQ